MPNTQFPIIRIYFIIVVLWISTIGINVYGIYDNAQRRAEAVANSKAERLASKKEILNKISEVEDWVKQLKKDNPNVNVPPLE